MKKIALVTDQLSIGGGLEHIYQIARHLSDFSFGIFGKKGNAAGKFKDLANIQIFDEGYHLPYITKFKPEIIHIHHLKPLFSQYSLPFISPKKPVFFTLHGAHIHKYEFLKGLKYRIEYPFRFHLEKYLFQRVDQLITVSPDDLQFIKEIYQLNNLTYIPNGLDIKRYSSKTKQNIFLQRKKLNLPSDAFLFLMVARYDYAKGHDILIKAIKHLNINGQPTKVKFVLIGNGSEKSVIQTMISDYGLKNEFILRDGIETSREIMRACDFLIVPSRWEGLPYVLLEAALYNIPVLASNTYGIRGVIRDQKNGLLFENQAPEDLARKIQEIISGKYSFEKLSRALFLDIKENYNINSCIRKLERLYNQWVT
jgi:glycosyltransferase involved in cell wall biosynthesis